MATTSAITKIGYRHGHTDLTQAAIFDSEACAVSLTPRRLWLISGAFVALHLVMFLIATVVVNRNWADILNGWDAEWYTRIATEGYQMPSWAFYPLLPMLIRLGLFVLPLGVAPQLVGAMLSVGCFLGLTGLAHYWLLSPDPKLNSLKPRSSWAWWCFCASPGAFVFHTCHTEMLFVLLTATAFTLAFKGRWFWAAVVAGLCALTRNQGIFVAICTGVIAALDRREGWERLWVFALVGMVSGVIYLSFPLHQYLATGDFFASVHAQYHWRPEMTLTSYLKTFWFDNAWQHVDLISGVRHLYFGALIYFTASLMLRRHYALLALVAVCLVLMPVSGELRSVLRYSAVLFPLCFAVGDHIATLRPKVALGVGLTMLLIHTINAQQYVLGHWSY